MTIEPEVRSGSWLIYATTFAVVLPFLYALSSGPAQCLERRNSGLFTVGPLVAEEDPRGAFRSGIFYRHDWIQPLATFYWPLNWLATSRVGKSYRESNPRFPAANRLLVWYWGLFGNHQYRHDIVRRG